MHWVTFLINPDLTLELPRNSYNEAKDRSRASSDSMCPRVGKDRTTHKDGKRLIDDAKCDLSRVHEATSLREKGNAS